MEAHKPIPTNAGEQDMSDKSNLIDQMIKNLKGSISDIEAVIDDLEAAKEDGDLSEVNEAYAREAVSRVHSVVDAIQAAP